MTDAERGIYGSIFRRGSGADCKSAVFMTRVVRLHLLPLSCCILGIHKMRRLNSYSLTLAGSTSGFKSPGFHPGVTGSIPVPATKFGVVAQVVSSRWTENPEMVVRLHPAPPNGDVAQMVSINA